jgi:hypothetical protein
LRGQAREAPRKFVERETHYLWGWRYLLTLRYEETKPSVVFDHPRITVTVRLGASSATRAEVLHEWHKSSLHDAVQALVTK